MNKHIFEKYLIFLSFCGLCVCLLVAWWINRTLLNDGTNWAYQLIVFGDIRFESFHLRVTDGIFQIIPWLIRKFFINTNVEFLVKTWGFVYVFHPLASVLACYALLRRFNKRDYFIWVVLALLFSHGVSHSFFASSSGLASSLFWPLFCLTMFGSRSHKNVIATVLLRVLIVFSYELSIFYFAFLLVLNIFFGIYKKKALRNFFLCMDLMCIGIIVFFLIRGQDHLYSGVDSLKRPFGAYTVFGFCTLILFYSLLWTNKWKASLVKLAKFIPLLLFVGPLFLFVCWVRSNPKSISIWSAYEGRVYENLLGAGWALFLALLVCAKSEVQKEFLKWGRWVFVSASFVWCCIDLRHSYLWQQGREIVQQYLDKPGACEVIEGKDSFKLIDSGVGSNFFPKTVILLQGSRDIQKVLFLKRSPNSINHCVLRQSEDHTFFVGKEDPQTSWKWFHLLLKDGYLSFKKVRDVLSQNEKKY